MKRKVIIIVGVIVLSFISFSLYIKEPNIFLQEEIKKEIITPHFWQFPIEKIIKKPNNELTTADIIWLEMRSWGWNEAVCAGIIGNMMAEAGGHSLNIQFEIYSSSGNYYGICQWSNKYHDIEGSSLQEQLDYLKITIEQELNTFGYKYQQNFNYEHFLTIADSGQAAEAFAKCYERCSSQTYEKRKMNAFFAYEHFLQKEREGYYG